MSKLLKACVVLSVLTIEVVKALRPNTPSTAEQQAIIDNQAKKIKLLEAEFRKHRVRMNAERGEPWLASKTLGN